MKLYLKKEQASRVLILLYSILISIIGLTCKDIAAETKPTKEDVIKILQAHKIARGNAMSSYTILETGEFSPEKMDVVITDYLAVSPDGAKGYKVEFKATDKSSKYSFYGEILFLKWESGWRAFTDRYIYIKSES